MAAVLYGFLLDLDLLAERRFFMDYEVGLRDD